MQLSWVRSSTCLMGQTLTPDDVRAFEAARGVSSEKRTRGSKGKGGHDGDGSESESAKKPRKAVSIPIALLWIFVLTQNTLDAVMDFLGEDSDS